MVYNTHSSRGFALLMTLLVISVVITAVLSILDVTIKQVRLAASAKDSESAFHAANAGLECARFWRRVSATQMESPTTGSFNVRCFSNAARSTTRVAVPATGGAGFANIYEYELPWGTSPDLRCSRVSTVVIVSDPTNSTTVTSADLKAEIPGYPGTANKVCPPSGICTVISVRGYNRTCTSVGSPGTIEREVLLEY